MNKHLKVSGKVVDGCHEASKVKKIILVMIANS